MKFSTLIKVHLKEKLYWTNIRSNNSVTPNIRSKNYISPFIQVVKCCNLWRPPISRMPPPLFVQGWDICHNEFTASYWTQFLAKTVEWVSHDWFEGSKINELLLSRSPPPFIIKVRWKSFIGLSKPSFQIFSSNEHDRMYVRISIL